MRVAFALLLTAVVTCGHDLYLMPVPFLAEPGQELLIVYENGDEFPRGVTNVNPARLRRTELLWKGGSVPFREITAEEKRTVARVRVPGEGTMVLVSYTVPNFIQLDAEKFRHYLEEEKLDHVLEWRRKNGETQKPGREIYSKYVKSLVRSGKADGYWAFQAGLTIEFIPEKDPYSLRPGDALPVRLLFRGEPAGGVAVESAWLENNQAKMETVGRTGRDGRIRIPIRAAGPHRLHAIVMERGRDTSRADWESFWATLTFEIPAGP